MSQIIAHVHASVNPASLISPVALPKSIGSGDSPSLADPYHVAEVWWVGFSAGFDGKPAAVPVGYPADLAASFLAGHGAGRAVRAGGFATPNPAVIAVEPCDHTTADELAWLGWTLGAEGVDAAPVGNLTAAERRAFLDGHNAGDSYLWTVDPLWAEHLRDRATRSALDDAYLAVDPLRDWHPAELVESAGRTR